MSRQPHDSLAKQFLADLLEPLGTSVTSRDVIDEPRQFDVYFEPREPPVPPPAELGLLGRIAALPNALEVFRNPPSQDDIEDSISKLYIRRGEQQREGANRSAILWVLSPTLSEACRRDCSAEPLAGWPVGVYRSVTPILPLHLIAIHKLPVTPDTLMLRLLGRGRTQQRAADEIGALPPSPRITRILELLANWRRTIEIRDNKDRDDEAVLMNLSPAFIRFRDELRAESREQGSRDAIAAALRARFGNDPELDTLVPALSALPLEEAMRLVVTESRDRLVSHLAN